MWGLGNIRLCIWGNFIIKSELWLGSMTDLRQVYIVSLASALQPPSEDSSDLIRLV